MIRPATVEDSPKIADLMEAAFKRSRYAANPKAGVDRTYALALLRTCVMRHGTRSAEGTWCNVWVENGKILGYHFGLEQRIAQVGNLYQAVNLHFYVDKSASPFAALSLLRSFYEWAAGRRRIIEISVDADDFFGDYEPLARAYRKQGFADASVVLRLELVRSASAEAKEAV